MFWILLSVLEYGFRLRSEKQLHFYQYVTMIYTSILSNAFVFLAGSSKSVVYTPSSYPRNAHRHRPLCGFLHPSARSLPLPIPLQLIEVHTIEHTWSRHLRWELGPHVGRILPVARHNYMDGTSYPELITVFSQGLFRPPRDQSYLR